MRYLDWHHCSLWYRNARHYLFDYLQSFTAQRVYLNTYKLKPLGGLGIPRKKINESNGIVNI